MKAQKKNYAIMKWNSLASVVALFAWVLLLPVSQLHSQSFYGSIVGTVIDSSGAAVPGATVTVTNVGTNEKHTMKSEVTGGFSFVNLVPAVYKLEVEAANFKHFVRMPIQVQVGSSTRVDASLEVGAATETVEVTTQTPLLQTESGQVGQQVEGKTVQEMPLNGRNTMNLIALTVGVVPQGGSMGSTAANQNSGNTSNMGWGNYQIGGGIAGTSASYIDGVNVNTVMNNALSLIPTQDAVQEFNVASNSVSSDFGRFEGGVVNMTTKSGTNQWHGSAYEYLRNTVLNGNNWFNKASQLSSGEKNKPTKWNENQYGVFASGPIKKDKAFFMFAWESLKLREAVASATYVPTTTMKAGKIPFLYSSGSLITVSDPLGNCTPVKNVSGGYWDLSGCSFNAAAKQFLNYYPDSNTGSSTYYYRAVVIGNNASQYNARVDYDLKQNQHIFGRYTNWSTSDIAFNQFPEAKYNVASGASIGATNNVVLGDTYTINPTTILDIRISWLRQKYNTDLPVTNADESTFFPNASFTSQERALLLPTFSLNSVRNFWTSWSRGGYNQVYNTNDQISANLVKIRGSHSIKVGTELALGNEEGSGNYTSGAFSYSGNYTGDEWADLLLGYAQSGSIGEANWTTAYNYYQAYYFQDTWHATKKLTLNLGIRYEFPGSLAEAHDKATVLLPGAVDPYTGIRGTLTLVNSSLYGHRTIRPTPRREISPRFGFAYRLSNNLAIRGGYGVVIPPAALGGGMPSSSTVNTASTPLSNSAALTSANVSSGSFVLMSNPFPSGLIMPYGRSTPNFMTSRLWTSSISGAIPTDPYPYMQQWNFSVSRQMKGDWMVDVGYAGSKGTHITALSGGLDELPSRYWSDGSLNTSQTVTLTTPIGGYSKSVTLGRSRQPYPYYSGFTDAASTWGSTNWNSFQVQGVKRFQSGGVLMVSYTWAKMLGDTDTSMSYLEPKADQNTAAGYGTVQDNNNHRAEHSLLSFNVPNRFVASYVLPMPFGHGQKYLGNLNGALDRLVSGWALNGITTFQTGFSLGLTEATSNNLTSTYGAGTLRPDVVSGCNKSESGGTRARLSKWFNTACFQAPGTSTNMVGWALGNAPRVDGQLRSEGIDNWDLSAVKSTRITERLKFEFRGEFFNIFNRTQFAPPFTNRGSTSFGQVVSQTNQPRLIQFSGRITF